MKDCGNHGDDHHHSFCCTFSCKSCTCSCKSDDDDSCDSGSECECEKKCIIKTIIITFMAICAIVGIIVFIIWLVLRPTKPQFYLQDVSVQSFNLSTWPKSSVSTALQVTVASRNPNGRIGIYYDVLNVFATYKDQQITVFTGIPPIYEGHNDVEFWSPWLVGDYVPVSPYLCGAMQEDVSAGFLVLDVKLDGRIRWKVGNWISGNYHLFATCPAFFTVVNNSGQLPAVRFQHMSACSVEV